MKFILLFTFLLPTFTYAQDFIIKEGAPYDLNESKIIFLNHENIEITAYKDSSKQQAYLHLRQINHNKVIKEANDKLKVAALDYPFAYVISKKSSFEPLVKAGYKYMLDSRAYNYDNLAVQPNEDELIVYEFFIRDLTTNLAYKVFELDEMKVYDSKLIIKRLNKKVKKVFPEAY
jgi:hypothetical protein